MNGLFLTLFSSSDLATYPQNRPNSFRTRFDQAIKIERGSRVSLFEASYKCSHEQVFQDAEIEIIDWTYYDPATKLFGKLYSKKFQNLDLPDGFALANILNYEIYKAVAHAKVRKDRPFRFDPERNRLWINFPIPKNKYWYTIKIHGSLVSLVGLEKKHATKREFCILGRDKPRGSYTYLDGSVRQFAPEVAFRWETEEEGVNFFKFAPQIAGITSIFLYASICDDVNIANTRGPLLRCIPLPSKPTTNRVTVSFGPSLIHVPVKSEIIDEIQVALVDISGQKIDFSSYTRLVLLITPPPKN